MLGTKKITDPLVSTLIIPHANTDYDKLLSILKDFQRTDAGLKIERSSSGITIYGQGQLHLDIVIAQIREAGINIQVGKPRISYLETLKPGIVKNEIFFKYRKQTGGSGKFADIKVMISPRLQEKENQGDSPIDIKFSIRGGEIDSKYFSSIEEGFREQAKLGGK